MAVAPHLHAQSDPSLGTWKLNGKVIQTTKAVVSPDGKVRTITATGTTPSGQKISNLIVLDKQ